MTEVAVTEQIAVDTTTRTPLLTVENLRISFGRPKSSRASRSPSAPGRRPAIVGEVGPTSAPPRAP